MNQPQPVICQQKIKKTPRYFVSIFRFHRNFYCVLLNSPFLVLPMVVSCLIQKWHTQPHQSRKYPQKWRTLFATVWRSTENKVHEWKTYRVYQQCRLSTSSCKINHSENIMLHAWYFKSVLFCLRSVKQYLFIDHSWDSRKGALKSLRLSDAYMHPQTKPSYVQEMVCCLFGVKLMGNIVDWIPKNKFQWDWSKNTAIFI